MKTIRLSQADMERRISQFQDLEPLPIQQDAEIPLAAKDLIYSRKLLSVVGLESAAETPINVAAPIVGAAGMTMTLAVCPPGQGPPSACELCARGKYSSSGVSCEQCPTGRYTYLTGSSKYVEFLTKIR